ncbi:hypothetical protein E2562_002921 [Oryza meyeriana var. granulata]|uniref:Uncharacterized protein n=1 Tax=Oryza meyeriana var. granulata TaxID=110450 RepID=A0A6G1DDH6_9ORYZ|nr:hypothetical protein E2562_002921 [Oryza meyeriana var. granulata]
MASHGHGAAGAVDRQVVAEVCTEGEGASSTAATEGDTGSGDILPVPSSLPPLEKEPGFWDGDVDGEVAQCAAVTAMESAAR